jgi:nucleotide-binding universal stress UspA family protein
MSLFQSILVPLDGSEASTKSLGCTAWLASQLNGRIHVLTAAAEVLPAGDALTRLKVPKEAWPLITVHQGLGDPEVEILAAIDRNAIDLIAITARGEAGGLTERRETVELSKIVGHVAEAVIENAAIPVLLIPPRYKEALPWKTVLVPMSGDIGTDASLMLAIQLANALDLKVNIVHVVDSATDETSARAMGGYSDQPHHEYPHMLNELISRACPLCSAEERRCIEDLSLARGDVAAEILRLVTTKRIDLLIVGWHGRFATGHAQVLKNLCETVTFPILLIKAAAKAKFKLKVGEEL